MMTPTNVIFMLGIPLAFAGIIALVVLSGRLRPAMRRRLELAMIGVFYPGMTIFFALRAALTAMQADWLSTALSAGLAVMVAVQGVILVRKRIRPDGTRT